MSHGVLVINENSSFLSCSRRSSRKSAVPNFFSGFATGASFDPSTLSRREALQEFHSLEMMAEVGGRLRTESGLVASDRNGDSDDACSLFGGDDTAGPSPQGTPVAATLRVVREELPSCSRHIDPYWMDDVWSAALRETKLEGESETEGWMGDDVLFSRQGGAMHQKKTIGINNHAAIMEDLRKVQHRIEQVRAHRLGISGGGWRIAGSAACGDVDDMLFLTGEDVMVHVGGSFEFDPEQYASSLLCCSGAFDNAGLWLPASGDGNSNVTHRTTLNDIFPDAASVQEAMQLLEFSVNSTRPDVVACVKRCQEEQRQHHPVTSISNVLSNDAADHVKRPHVSEMGSRKRKSPLKKEKKVVLVNCAEETKEKEEEEEEREEKGDERVVFCPAQSARQQQQLSVSTLAEMITKTLPKVPNELREELASQRQVLERILAAQKESLRQHAREREDAARRRLMAPRADHSLAPLFSSVPQSTGMFEISGTRESFRGDEKQALPPVITLTTMRRGLPSVPRPELPYAPPNCKEELGRLCRQYEELLRDERKAWTELMKKQHEAFEKEKNALVVEAVQCAAVRRQRESTDEIKRVLARQEVKQQREQHAAEVRQQQAIQQMLHVALLPEKKKSTATTLKTRNSYLPCLKKNKEVVVSKRDHQNGEANVQGKIGAMANEEGGKKGSRSLNSVVKGPFRVILPDEELEIPKPSAVDAMSLSVNEVVVLSDEEVKVDSFRPNCKAREGGGKAHSSFKQRRTPLPKRNGVAVRYSQRSPYAESTKKHLDFASGSKKRIPPKNSHKEGLRRLSPAQRKTKDSVASPYAFSLLDGVTGIERTFDNTAESILSNSFHSCEATTLQKLSSNAAGFVSPLLKDPYATAFDGNIEPKAVFPGTVLILSDALTPEEVATRRNVERAYDVSLSVPLPIIKSMEGEGNNNVEIAKRPCDVYFFGKEDDSLTPSQRTKLRAASAQTCLETRRRLERIKALTLAPRSQLLGEPFQYTQYGPHNLHETNGELASFIAKEVVHCVIGKEAEKSLFEDLIRELERDIVRAELQRLACEYNGESYADHLEQQRMDGTDMTQAERVLRGVSSSTLPIHTEYLMEETLLRHIEEDLLRSVTQLALETGKDVMKNEKIVETLPVVLNESCTNQQSDEIDDVAQEPFWVHEIISVTTDPIWRAPVHDDGAVVCNPTPAQQSSEQTTTNKDCVLRVPVSTPEAGVSVSVDTGAGANVVPDEKGTIRIVVDVAPLIRQVTAAAPQNLFFRPLLPSCAQQNVPGAQPAGNYVVGNEERRLFCATEEDLSLCEVVDAPTIRDTDARKETKNAKEDGQKTEEACNNLPMGNSEEVYFSLKTRADDAGVLQSSIQLFEEATTATVLVFQQQQRQYWDMVHQKERLRCQEDEKNQREMIEEQEETLRAMFPVFWDLQKTNVSIANKQHSNLKGTADKASPVVPVVCVAEDEVVHNYDKNLSTVSPPSGFCDPVTRFIFEWMHEYNEQNNKNNEEKAQKSLSKRHFGTNLLLGEVKGSDTDDKVTFLGTDMPVCGSLLPYINNTDSSSSWLTTTHPSSTSENGFLRFASATANFFSGVRPKCNGNDERLSSMATETTRYTDFSRSPFVFQNGARACDNLLMSTEGTTTNTTQTTLSTSPICCSSSSSVEKPRLSDTVLRRIRKT